VSKRALVLPRVLAAAGLLSFALSAAPAARADGHAFERFCGEWMEKLAQRERDNVANLRMVQRDGRFVGEFVGYGKAPVRCTAKPTGHRDNPYVGRLVYHEIRYRHAGPTASEARRNMAAEVTRTEVMEIFRFDGQRWVY
jgi:hypothetical protein